MKNVRAIPSRREKPDGIPLRLTNTTNSLFG
jgi:hypothetical protein